MHREHYDFSREVKLTSFNCQGWKREDKEERVGGRNDDEKVKTHFQQLFLFLSSDAKCSKIILIIDSELQLLF